MVIKNVVKNAAELLNKENVIKYLNKGAPEGDAVETVEKLVRLTNLVMSDLSHLGYYISRTQWLSPKDGKILFSAFRSRPIKIIEILDNDGKPLEYEMTTDGLRVSDKANTFVYAYEINNETIDTNINFEDYRLTDVMVAYGVAAEYLLTMHDFDGAVFWHEKFVDAVKSLKTTKNFRVKERSFN